MQVVVFAVAHLFGAVVLLHGRPATAGDNYGDDEDEYDKDDERRKGIGGKNSAAAAARCCW